MVAALLSSPTTSVSLPDLIHYSRSGVYRRVLSKDSVCRSSLFCLTAGTSISRQTTPHNSTLYVLEGKGTLMLHDDLMVLEPGQFVTVPAHMPHALKAIGNLAFVLTLSAVA